MPKHDSDSSASSVKSKGGVRRSASSMKVSRPKDDDATPIKPKRDKRQIIITVVIVFFAVLMALSMMLPSLAQVFTSNEQRRQAEEEAAAAAAAAAGSGSSAAASYNLNTVDGVIEAYSDTIAELEERLATDPDNLAYILSCGQAYMNCAYNAAQRANTDDEATKVVTFFQTAENYFDQYLAIKETDAVKVDHALCELYQGNVEQAVSELRAITQATPDYAPAWMNLGMAYEVVGQNDAALAAYTKAKETDPENDYGARLFATNRIQQLQSEMQQTEVSYNQTGTTENSGVVNLWNDLSSGQSTSATTSTGSTDALDEALDDAPTE